MNEPVQGFVDEQRWSPRLIGGAGLVSEAQISSLVWNAVRGVLLNAANLFFELR